MPEDKIFLLSLLMAEMGVHSVAYAFPRVRIITTAVDKRVNDLFRIIPGIGESAVAQGAWLMTQGDPVTQCHFFSQGTLVIATLGQMQSLMAVMRRRQPLWVSPLSELLLLPPSLLSPGLESQRQHSNLFEFKDVSNKIQFTHFIK